MTTFTSAPRGPQAEDALDGVPQFTANGGDWAAIAIQVILAAGVILIGFAMSHRAKSQTA